MWYVLINMIRNDIVVNNYVIEKEALKEYAKPLIDAMGDDVEQIVKALKIAKFCWHLALLEQNHERILNAIIKNMQDDAKTSDENTQQLRNTILMMIDRHKTMFPEMHIKNESKNTSKTIIDSNKAIKKRRKPKIS